MRRLIAFISILLLASIVADATNTNITIYGTNKSNAQTNVTCYGCNNTISVQAWNTSYVKNITVESRNGTGGDVVLFNISNVTAFQVQELKVNKTVVNGYQAGANGMLNFSYTVVGNKTFVLSPAVNVNGYNMTWARIWNQASLSCTQPTKAFATVYRNNGNDRYVNVNAANGAGTEAVSYTDSVNPPTTIFIRHWIVAGQTSPVSFWVAPYQYYRITNAGGSILEWIECE